MAEEKVFTINLKKEFSKNSRWKKSNRASREVRRFLERHMKSDQVKIGSSINEAIWARGDQKPPSKLKIKAVKDDDEVVRAELFGVEFPEEIEESKSENKEEKKKEKDKEKKENEKSKKEEKPKKESEKSEKKK